jgi:phosphopantetheinyl transferase
MAVEIWTIDLAAAGIHCESILKGKVLSKKECQRANNILNSTQRAEYICGTAAVRAILHDYYQTGDYLRPFAFSKNGKPTIAGSKIGFSYSRAKALTLLAVNTQGTVGVDVECISNSVAGIKNDVELQKILAPLIQFLEKEKQFLIPDTPTLLVAWTLLEALIKLHDKSIRWAVGDQGKLWLKNITKCGLNIRCAPLATSDNYIFTIAAPNNVAKLQHSAKIIAFEISKIADN